MAPDTNKNIDKSIILVMNEVFVARLGLILSQDGATLTRKLFKYLPGLFSAVDGPKIHKKSEHLIHQ